jgi:cytochrome c-type biogenesis protein CcmH
LTLRRASWLLLLVVLSVGLAIGASEDAGPHSSADRLTGLTRSIRCPTCQSQSVAESDSPLAGEIRRDLAARVDAGQSDDEIRDYLVSRYGQEVLLTPPRAGLAGLVWVLPVTALVVALAVLVVTFRRWHTAGVLHPDDADRALVEAALHDEVDDEVQP